MPSSVERIPVVVTLCFASAIARAADVPSDAGWRAMPSSLLPIRLPVDAAARWVVSADASAFEATDAVPVRDLSGRWAHYSPRGGRNAGLESSRAEVAARYRRWELAVVARSDFLVTGPRSTWDAVHVYKSKGTPADGASFDIAARFRGINWTGVRAGHSWDLLADTPSSLQLTTAVTLLSVRRLEDVDATGRIGYGAAAGYAFQVDAGRQDTSRQYGGYGLKGTTGSGYSADLGLLWKPAEGRFVNLSAVDLLSRVKVDSVGTERATLSSSTRSVDGDGFLDYKPLVSGRYSSNRVETTLGRKWSVVAGSTLPGFDPRLQIGGRFERVGELNLPALWATVPLVAGFSGQVDADLRFHSLGLGIATRYGSVLLRSQSTRVGESKALGAQASLRLPL